MSFPFQTPVQQLALHIGEGDTTSRGLSPALWGHMNKAAISADGRDTAVRFYDNFSAATGLSVVSAGVIAAPNAAGTNLDGYRAYIFTGGIALKNGGTGGGGMTLKTVATINKCAIIGTDDLCAISDTSADSKLTIWEAVITAPEIAIGATSVGLGSKAGIVASGLATAGEYINAGGSFVGFRTLDASPTALDFVYKAAGDAAATVVISGLQTLVAATQYKVGFVYDPGAPEAKRIKVYLDDVEQSTFVTADNIAAATFPDAEQTGMVASVKAGAGAIKQLTVHEWGLFQEG